MSARLEAGDHVVVTGGSSGLGEALAARLVDRGVAVTLVARREAALRDAADRLRVGRGSAQVWTESVDVSDDAQPTELFARIEAAGRPVDALINSAGILREGYFETLERRDFTDVMAVNFQGTVDMIRAGLPALKRSRGRIVNIASVAGLMGVFGYTPYCAAKHALVGFTDSLRYELGPQGVRVHLVCPGEFDSPMVDELDATRTPENRAHTLTIPKSSVQAVARDVMAGLDKDRDRIVPGRRTVAAVLGQRLAPAIAERVARRRIAQAVEAS